MRADHGSLVTDCGKLRKRHCHYRPACCSAAIRDTQPSLSPKILESRRRQLGIPDGVLNVLVAEIGLQRPRVVASIGQCKSAGVAEHMRVRFDGQLSGSVIVSHSIAFPCTRSLWA